MNLNQITVPVSNVENAIVFYERLGLTLIVKALPHYARFACPVGDATFSVHLSDIKRIGEGAWIYFEVEHLDDYVQALMAAGIVFEQLPEDKPWLWREARIKDLDQNQLVFYYAGANRKDPPWKVAK